MTVTYNFKPCPFCGHDLNKQDFLDTLYRAYRTANGSYIYNVVCQENAGGCDACVLGETPQEAYERWNTRV